MVASIEQYASEFEPPPPPRKIITQADLDPSESWGGWNLLDQQVALLKGWEYDPMEHGWWMSPEDKAAGRYWFGGLQWASSDSKALELVDELQGKFAFNLSCAPSGIMWYATFSPVYHSLIHLELTKSEGSGYTRPVAICRAYIAAMTWMKEKKS